MSQKHYFIENPDLPVDERVLEISLFGHDFRFTTTTGLFSYERIDDASRLLLEVIRSALPPLSGTLLDLGCGYGLLGIVLAKAHSVGLRLTMSDVNRIACTYAARNATANGVTATTVCSDGFSDINGCFDHILLNPPIHAGKETMYRLYAESATHLNPDGALHVVIQKKHGAETAARFLRQHFTDVQIPHKRKGFYVLRCALQDVTFALPL
ncbi:MAG: methyltransferase [Defluviitaleaceae bacterium]|nr:methyltransferase [Defluviitaleaceae bacterium]